MLTRLDQSAKEALVAGARRVAESGLVVGSAGNVSVRAGNSILITRGGALLKDVAPEDCLEVGLSEGVISGAPGSGFRPSSELPLHLAVYAATDAAAIVHTHSHYATVLGTLVDELPAVHYTINHFGGTVRVARYQTFGTEELAAAVSEALRDRSAALMANHGAVVTGRDVESAVSGAIELEWLASIYYHAILCGTPSILSDDQLGAVRDRARQLRYGIEAGAR
jgi:L-fuculose-phosphate aldolase